MRDTNIESGIETEQALPDLLCRLAIKPSIARLARIHSDRMERAQAVGNGGTPDIAWISPLSMHDDGLLPKSADSMGTSFAEKGAA